MRPIRCWCFLFLSLLGSRRTSFAGEDQNRELAQEFARSIRPILQQFCYGCHSTEKHKGDLDLERFASFQDVLRHPKEWQQVIEQLSLGEMPPKGKPSPASAQRDQLLNWINRGLAAAALAHAGDPGAVPLRRLNNAEYTHTIRDLTGVPALDPAKTFPGDNAAGEGFMNTGSSLVMSPALLGKYLDAGKEIALHAVLLPDGFRFSAKTTRRDWTEEVLAEIREIYRQFTDSHGAEKVNLQGIIFDTNEGGRLPLEAYLLATVEWRGQVEHTQLIESKGSSITSVTLPGSGIERNNSQLRQFAVERGLSPKYLESLWMLLNDPHPSLVLDPIRARWRASQPGGLTELVSAIRLWQKALWKFSSVGHIGKAGGPKAWMEPLDPLVEKQEFRWKLVAPANDNSISLFLSATDAGDGNTQDFVVWEQPRLIVPGGSTLLLRDAREFIRNATGQRRRIFAATAACLEAADALSTPQDWSWLAEAQERGIDPEALRAWFGFLGIDTNRALKLAYFTNQLSSSGGYDFVKGWGSTETPNLVANSSDRSVRIPGNLKGHGVAVHPSPKLNAAVGWQSAMASEVRVSAQITHAHPECGNGVEWFVELRRGKIRQRLGRGVAQGGKPVQAGPFKNIGVRPGDMVSLLIGPRGGNHSCDLTEVELNIHEERDHGVEWDLARDVSGNVVEANPHPDRFGNAGVWHFYADPAGAADQGPAIPAESLLARWQSAAAPEEKRRLAGALQTLLLSGSPEDRNTPDAILYAQLASLAGPLSFRAAGESSGLRKEGGSANSISPSTEDEWGLDPALFGKHPDGSGIEPGNLCVRAPFALELRFPADLLAGAEFVSTAVLDKRTGREGSVQLQAGQSRVVPQAALIPSAAVVVKTGGVWTSDNSSVSQSLPVLVQSDSAARHRIEADFSEFRRWFPAALCYQKIVPVDEVITLTLFHREDEPLCRLMLDDEQKARLDRLWDELRFISRDAITLVDAFEQLWQYATQDADPKVFEPLRQPIRDRAEALQRRLVQSERRQVDALIEFASRAYRHPISGDEARQLRELYAKLRQEELPHEEAFQLTLARVFIAPAFLYRLEKSKPGAQSHAVSSWELASRLSYFLWSSAPDEELRRLAASGKLSNPEELVTQSRRMLQDARVRRLAVEFGCAWLHLYDFNELNEKSERHFPAFASLREPMFEEAVRYLTDLVQTDSSVLELFDSDHAFLNEALAKQYGIANVTGPEWRRVDGVKAYGRGGVLGFGATLAKQSGASRTSPILRGNWVAEVLLGEKLPRPPKDVPKLPEDESADSLTVRQLVEKHSSDPRCASCHTRIDGYGFALEGFDAIGLGRTHDLGGRTIETKAKLFDGTVVEGAAGLREYLLNQKRDAVLRQFCRKLLGYALGRSVILSDYPLLDDMQTQLRAKGYHFSAAAETILRSRQFQQIRGLDMTDDSIPNESLIKASL